MARIAENYLEHDDVKALTDGNSTVVGLEENGTCIYYDPEIGLYNDGETPDEHLLSSGEMQRLRSIGFMHHAGSE